MVASGLSLVVDGWWAPSPNHSADEGDRWGLCGLRPPWLGPRPPTCTLLSNLVDPASSHMLVSKIKPCMSQYKLLYGETANGSLKQL